MCVLAYVYGYIFGDQNTSSFLSVQVLKISPEEVTKNMNL
jgi:hypothetical protein